LQVVACFGAAADHKGVCVMRTKRRRAVRRDDFENCFTGKGRGVGHGPLGAEL